MQISFRKIGHVAWREIRTIVMTKGFLAMLVMPLVILLVMALLIPLAESLMRKSKQMRTESLKIGVITDTPAIVETWEERLKSEKLQNGLPLFKLMNVSSPSLPEETLIETAKAKVRDKEWDGYVHMIGDITDQGKAEFYFLRGLDMSFPHTLANRLGQVVREKRLEREGFDPERINHLTRWIDWNDFELSAVAVSTGGEGEEGETKKRFSFEKIFAPALTCIMLMFFLTFMTCQRMLRGIVEEKTSRVVEVILSSISPSEMLYGKVFGFYIIGVIQFIVWVATGIILLWLKDIPVSDFIPPAYFLKFLIFLTTGYFFYAAVFAGIGAIVGDETESQQIQGIITLIIVIPLMFNFVLITQPNWWVVRLISFIPFLTPTVMAVRMVVTQIPWWETTLIATSTILFAILGIWLAARIFRIGILMTGKRPSVRELWRWCWYKDVSGVIET